MEQQLIIHLTFQGQVINGLNMGTTKSIKIREDYSLYNRLLEERKSVFKECVPEVDFKTLHVEKENVIIQNDEPIIIKSVKY